MDMGKGILMVLENDSEYCWLFTFQTTSAKNSALPLIDWCSAFYFPGLLMSDGPAHFKNKTIIIVSKGLNSPIV